MATVITEECINCGACEPECPNTAIYQGGVEWELDGVKHPPISNAIFYIVPEKCTECVGFYDHEACAAVCPVDCCVPDPKIPETEDVLIARARKLHPEQEFGAEFPSRFRKEGGGSEVDAAAPPAAPPAAAAAQATSVSVAPSEAPGLSIPPLSEWEVPISCFRCDGEYTVPFEYFRPGVVFYCPHCTGSFVPNGPIYDRISRLLRTFHDAWTRSFEAFHDKRQRELEAFEKKQRELLDGFQQELRTIARDAQPSGARPKRRSMFG